MIVGSTSSDFCVVWKQARQQVKGRLMMKEVKHIKGVVGPRNDT